MARPGPLTATVGVVTSEAIHRLGAWRRADTAWLAVSVISAVVLVAFMANWVALPAPVAVLVSYLLGRADGRATMRAAACRILREYASRTSTPR